MNCYFEKVPAFQNVDFEMPQRKTKDSAGYDFVVAQDTIVPSYIGLMDALVDSYGIDDHYTVTLNEMATRTKKTGFKPTLVPTGVCCHMPPNYYLQLSVRSSCPLKNWLILANGVGIIDSDFVNGDTNGHIMFQLINLSPWPILLKKGDRIGQGILLKYETTDNDDANGERTGGFGSTN